MGKFSVDVLDKFSVECFIKSGLSEADAKIAAATIVDAEVQGVKSHGLMRLPFYCKRLLQGGSKTHPDIKVVTERAATVLLDGDNGLGQIVGTRAMELAVKKARNAGICFVGVKNSGHFGMASSYTRIAAKEDMIGLASTNTAPIMTAWGGKKLSIGNNPICAAVPTGREFPIVLDIAMSNVAAGKVRMAILKKEKIPFGWILDSQGHPTEDPEDYVKGGVLLPVGEHKGYGLAVILEILTSVLTGANMLSQAGWFVKDFDKPITHGHFFIAIDVTAFMDLSGFKKRMEHLINEIKDQPLAEGSKEIFLPGEIEYLSRKSCEKVGVQVGSEVLKSLDEFSDEIHVSKLTDVH